MLDKGAISTAEVDSDYKDAHKLYQVADLSATGLLECYNDVGDRMSAAASAGYDLAAGDVKTINCKISGVYQKAFSSVGNPLLWYEYDTTTIGLDSCRS